MVTGAFPCASRTALEQRTGRRVPANTPLWPLETDLDPRKSKEGINRKLSILLCPLNTAPSQGLSKKIVEDLSPLIRLTVPEHISTGPLPLDIFADVIGKCEKQISRTWKNFLNGYLGILVT